MVTEEELNKLRVTENRLLVGVNLKQKSDYEIEFVNGTRLWIDSNWGFDGKVTKPSLAKVYRVGEGITDIKEGDIILCGHMTFAKELPGGGLWGQMGIDKENLDLFVINYMDVECIIGQDLEEWPLKDKLIVERIVNKPDTFLHIPESAIKTEKNFFKVVKAGMECEGVKDGDVIIAHTYSDYEIHYTLNYKPKTCVTIRYSDVLGIKH